MEKKYLTIMIESLQKKEQILKNIQAANEVQKECFEREEPDLALFDQKVDEKSSYIDELDRLDEGFDALYDKVKNALEAEDGKSKYATEILSMQQLITSITQLSTSIQAMEARNKKAVETYFQGTRSQIKTGRTSSKAAMDYYKNMQKTQVITPQFMDNKK